MRKSASNTRLDPTTLPKKTTSIKSLPSLQPRQQQQQLPITPQIQQTTNQPPPLSTNQSQSSLHQFTKNDIIERDRATTLSSMDIPFHPVERDRDNEQQEPIISKLRPDFSRSRSTTLPNFVNFEILSNSNLPSTPSLTSIPSNHPESPTWLLSDLLSNLSSLKDKDEYSIVQKSNDLVTLFQTYPNLKEEVQIKTVLPRIQFMLYHRISEVRSSCYRILRHLIVNYQSLILLGQSKILIFIIVSLANDQSKSSIIEMEQALKLIRQYMTIEKGADLLSVGVIKALIAIVENDKYDYHKTNSINTNYGINSESIPMGFKNACIETISEIALLKPELVFHSGGFKLMINSIIEGPFEVSSTCLLIILRILSYQNSRKFLRNGFDLDSLISIFSSEENNENLKKFENLNNFKLQKISFLISTLLKDFNGLIAYSINDFTSIQNLLINLTKKNNRVQDLVLDILLDALRIKVFPWLENSPIGDYVSRYNDYKKRNGKGHEHLKFEYTTSKEPFLNDIVHHYQGLLTYILIVNDVFEHLIGLIQDSASSEELRQKATLLITKLNAIASNYLPQELIKKKLQSLNFSSHISFEVVNLTRTKPENNPEQNQYIKTNMKKISIQASNNVDDEEFKNMITNSRVLVIKEFEDWNWPLLSSLVQGPLKSSKRFEEVLEKSPKFFKRLVSFYRPFKYRFSTVHIQSKNYQKYINFGCLLLEMFLSSEIGTKYLSSTKLLPQLSEIVAQIDPYSGITSKDPVLSKKRLENTASIGYIRFLGVLSGSIEGLNLLSNWQFFTLISDIISASNEIENNNYFILTLFKYIDFSIENSQFKNLLQMCLNISNLKIKSCLLKHLLPQLVNNKDSEEFSIRILVENFYNRNHEIVENSILFLYNHYKANDFQNVDIFLKYSPSISIMKKYNIGKNFLVQLLQNIKSFRYLEDEGYIEEEFNKWCQIKKFKFVRKIDELIRLQFFPYVNTNNIENNDNNDNEFENYSLNFFKCLLSTEEGLNFFNKGIAKDFLDQLLSSIEIIFNQISNDNEFLDIDNQDEIHCDLLGLLRQNLWIIGQIGSGNFGIQLLDPMYNINLKSSIIELILDNFHNCPVWEIRGLCFYVIGMISTTVEGMEILDEFGWYSVLDQYGRSMNLAYPKQIIDGPINSNHDKANLFNVSIINPYRDKRYFHIFNSLVDKTNDEIQSPITIRIFTYLQNLNSILSKIELKAVKELIKIKQQYNDIFEDVDLFLDVIRLIDKGNFSFHKRVFIFKLFSDGSVLEYILKKEKRGSFKFQV
ncbi:uncharacterized protein KGF55_003306 [Candida pseudojiufengensis]|uniref:uncharacterized protein n=1 Tax=Candida pseudojiufengensis TaxID=497109 RepID=UPI00222432FA|nr:uncharacterized protein KGF55_003306 [Candida pseudojiufengensis]KAI5962230.1 hypothetical protein KGF55_003306 [Candida pseudojiufengensis]